MKKEKKNKKKRSILNKAKIALLAPILSFIFTKSVHGERVVIINMYIAPPSSPLDFASSLTNFLAYILLVPSVLMAVVYIILKKRKSKKRWPKIVLIILISLTVFLYIASFVIPLIDRHFFGYY